MTGRISKPPPAPFGWRTYLAQVPSYRGIVGIDVWAGSWIEAEIVLAEQHPEGQIIGELAGFIDE